jgi:sulfofructose kinase
MAMVVCGVGQCCWDSLLVVPAYPAADSKNEVTAWQEEGGGPVATALVALSRFGNRCRFAGVTGDDPAGERIVDSLMREGVDPMGLVVRPGSSSQRAVVIVEPEAGSRTIFWQRPTGLPLAGPELPAGFFDECRFLLLDGLLAEASLAAAGEARRQGIPVMLDAGRLRPGMTELAAKCDYVVAAQQYALDLGWDGTVAGFVRLAGQLDYPVFTVTCGSRGSITWAAGEVQQVQAFSVTTLDSTGAGDIFHAGYLHGLLQGWQLPLVLTFATACAALNCTRLGGRSGIPSLADVAGFLASRGMNLAIS